MTPEALAKIANPKKVTLKQIKAYEKKEKLHFTEDHIAFLLNYNGFILEEYPYTTLYDLEEIYSYYPDPGECYAYKFAHNIIGTWNETEELIQITEKR